MWSSERKKVTWTCFIATNHVELLLQFLIGVVDTELLKAVHFKHLKPIDVQHPDEGVCLCRAPQRLVDSGDNPLEQLRVKVLCQTIPGTSSLGRKDCWLIGLLQLKLRLISFSFNHTLESHYWKA